MEAGRNPSESPSKGSLKMHKIKVAADGETPNLPEEIIVDILTRLPVKSLLKFRCVSKIWCSLISSRSFVRSHLLAAEKDSCFTSDGVMLTVSEPAGLKLKQASLRSVMDEPSIDGVSVTYPRKHQHNSVWVVGTHNGLICIAIDEKDLHLWNPATRVSTRLPTVEVDLKPGFYNMFGFGYSEATEEYKVLGIFCNFDENFQSVVKIYSQKANSWKTLESYRNRVPLQDSGRLANGKLHFAMAPGLVSASRWEIVSFDLDSEKYGIIEQPNYGEWSSENSLGVLGGCICVICHGYNQQRAHHVDLWVLKEYGVKESWTKLVRIQTIDGAGKYDLNPTIMLPNGDVLLVCGGRLAIYNPKDGVWTYPEIRNVQLILDADVYVESLVSPHLLAN